MPMELVARSCAGARVWVARRLAASRPLWKSPGAARRAVAGGWSRPLADAAVVGTAPRVAGAAASPCPTRTPLAKRAAAASRPARGSRRRRRRCCRRSRRCWAGTRAGAPRRVPQSGVPRSGAARRPRPAPSSPRSSPGLPTGRRSGTPHRRARGRTRQRTTFGARGPIRCVVLKDLSSPILILIVLQGLLSHPLFHGACVCNLCVCYAREVCRGPLSRHTRAAPEAGKRKGEAGRHTSSAE
jgi:hypothetical protein